MDFEAIKNMIEVMDSSKLGYLEVNWQDISIIMKKEGEKGNVKQINFVKENQHEDNISLEKKEKKKKDAADEFETDKKRESREGEEGSIKGDNIKNVTSPIVGTFYSSSAPGKPPFVNVGSRVKKGDTLCVIEAMKLMNEIQSEVDGEVAEISVKNEQTVEYGQVLFKINTDS